MTAKPLIVSNSAPRFGTVPGGDRTGMRGLDIEIVMLIGTIYLVAFSPLLAHFNAGGLSGNGYATIMIILVIIAFTMLRLGFPKSIIKPMFLVFLFGLLLCIDCISNPIPYPQVACLLGLFVVLLYFSARQVLRNPSFASTILILNRRSLYIACGLYLILLPFSHLREDRGFAIAATMGLPTILSSVVPGNRRNLWIYLGITALVIFSLSRTASAVCLLLWALSRAGYARSRLAFVFKSALSAVISSACFVLFILYFPEFQERFFFGKSLDTVLAGGGSLNTEGRDVLWATTLLSWRTSRRSVLFGKGIGTASEISMRVLRLAHPHNDYLRLLHDMGAVGAVVYVLALVLLLKRTYRYWRSSPSVDSIEFRVHGAAFLATFGFMLIMITDNPVDYTIAVVPLTTLLGASIGLSVTEHRTVQAVKMAARRGPLFVNRAQPLPRLGVPLR